MDSDGLRCQWRPLLRPPGPRRRFRFSTLTRKVQPRSLSEDRSGLWNRARSSAAVGSESVDAGALIGTVTVGRCSLALRLAVTVPR
jgi:hypothetical protein